MLTPSTRKRTCRVTDNSGLHQEEEDALFPIVNKAFGFLREDLRNSPKQGATDYAPLSQGAFPQVKTLDRKNKAVLPPLGNSSFLHVHCKARHRVF